MDVRLWRDLLLVVGKDILTVSRAESEVAIIAVATSARGRRGDRSRSKTVAFR